MFVPNTTELIRMRDFVVFLLGICLNNTTDWITLNVSFFDLHSNQKAESYSLIWLSPVWLHGNIFREYPFHITNIIRISTILVSAVFVCVYKRKQFIHFVTLLEGPDMFKNEVEGCILKPEITNKVENVRIWKCIKTYMSWTSLQYCVYFSKCWEWAMNAWIFRIFTWDQRTDWHWSTDVLGLE